MISSYYRLRKVSFEWLLAPVVTFQSHYAATAIKAKEASTVFASFMKTEI